MATIEALSWLPIVVVLTRISFDEVLMPSFPNSRIRMAVPETSPLFNPLSVQTNAKPPNGKAAPET